MIIVTLDIIILCFYFRSTSATLNVCGSSKESNQFVVLIFLWWVPCCYSNQQCMLFQQLYMYFSWIMSVISLRLFFASQKILHLLQNTLCRDNLIGTPLCKRCPWVLSMQIDFVFFHSQFCNGSRTNKWCYNMSLHCIICPLLKVPWYCFMVALIRNAISVVYIIPTVHV